VTGKCTWVRIEQAWRVQEADSGSELKISVYQKALVLTRGREDVTFSTKKEQGDGPWFRNN
jgi:hypothetical protein